MDSSKHTHSCRNCEEMIIWHSLGTHPSSQAGHQALREAHLPYRLSSLYENEPSWTTLFLWLNCQLPQELIGNRLPNQPRNLVRITSLPPVLHVQSLNHTPIFVIFTPRPLVEASPPFFPHSPGFYADHGGIPSIPPYCRNYQLPTRSTPQAHFQSLRVSLNI